MSSRLYIRYPLIGCLCSVSLPSAPHDRMVFGHTPSSSAAFFTRTNSVRSDVIWLHALKTVEHPQKNYAKVTKKCSGCVATSMFRGIEFIPQRAPEGCCGPSNADLLCGKTRKSLVKARVGEVSNDKQLGRVFKNLELRRALRRRSLDRTSALASMRSH